MQKILILTDARTHAKILVGAESIIDARPCELGNSQNNNTIKCTKIESRGGMVSVNHVLETVQQIYNQYKSE